jgi:FKBP-type peptidyl-prolyl cis-trans isomerase
MARKRERAFAAFGAGLFLLTSSALTIGVIYTIVQQHNQKPNDGATTSNSQKTTNQTKLTGTKMQNFTPTAQPQAQLQVIDTKVGTGQVAKPSDTITADYVGALMSDGTIFDAASDHGGPQTFPLSKVIAGWSQGIPGMKVGGVRRLLIPASLAYGPQAQAGIPANSDLVFDVTLSAISK